MGVYLVNYQQTKKAISKPGTTVKLGEENVN